MLLHQNVWIQRLFFHTYITYLANHVLIYIVIGFTGFSPSVFKTVAKVAEESKFKWTIEEMSNLKPADIDETTIELFDPIESDPHHELMAQARIERFFSEKHIVSSPFNNLVKSVELLKPPPAVPAAVHTAEGDTHTYDRRKKYYL